MQLMLIFRKYIFSYYFRIKLSLLCHFYRNQQHYHKTPFLCIRLHNIKNIKIYILCLYRLQHNILHDSMGTFFSEVKKKKINVDKQLLNATGSKLREYFGSYQQICENFSISTHEYSIIFGSNAKSFDVWDSQRQGFINAIQMFSGLIVFSQMSYQDKIKMLYEFFDLNQEKFLDYDGLAFMFISVCEATCKIYQLKDQVFNEEIVSQFLDQFFSSQTQLKYSDFIRWSYRTEQIIQYFQIIGHPFTPQKNNYSMQNYSKTNLKSKRASFLSPFAAMIESKSKIKVDERFLNLIKNDHILLQQQPPQQRQVQFNPMMRWIYGMRVDDIRYPLHYRKTQFYKAANQRFLYICGKNVVVLYPKLNVQKNYTDHSKAVSCIQIAQCDTIVASGQMGINPSIHVWFLKGAKCFRKFDGVHKNAIKILKFTKNDELLITVSERENSPLVMLNVETKQKVLSTYLLEPILNILHPNSHADSRHHQFFMVLPSYVVKCYSSDGSGYSIQYHQSNALNEQTKQNRIEIPKIKSGAAIKIGQQTAILVFDQKNNVAVFESNKMERQCINNTDVPNPSKRNYGTKKQIYQNSQYQQQNIVDVFQSENKKRIYFLFKQSFKIYEFECQGGLRFIKDVRNIPKGLFNLQFVQLLQVSEDCVILVSLMGDVIKISNLMAQSDWNQKIIKSSSCEGQIPRGKDYYNESRKVIEQSKHFQIDEDEQNSLDISNPGQNKLSFHRYYQIFKLQKISGICFLSKQTHEINAEQKPLLLIASNSLLYFIDQVQKELVYFDCIEQNITNIHSFGNTYAIATDQKNLMIYQGKTAIQIRKGFGSSSASKINGFKLTADNLIVAVDQSIEVFFKSGGAYFREDPKRIKLDHGIPIHITMTSIPKVFLVITRQKTILKLNSESKQKNPVLTAKQLNCDFLQTYYIQANTIKVPILFSGTKRVFLLAQPNGDIYYWNSLNHMINRQQSFSMLSGHSSTVNELQFTENGFISSGAQDGQVIIWESWQTLEEVGDDQEQKQSQKLKIQKNMQKLKSNDDQINLITKNRQQANNSKLISQLFIEEVQVFDKYTCDKLQLKDSQIQVIVKDQQIYKDIKKNINNILLPKNLDLYEPLVHEKKIIPVEHDKKNSKKIAKQEMNQSLKFKCSFVYGFTSEKTRQSLFYVHSYSLANNKGRKVQLKNEADKGNFLSQKSKQIQYAQEMLLPLNETHSNCRRNFMYFTGRIGVIWSPTLKAQLHYDFHINRITSACIHPNKTIICTAEASNMLAVVHVWSAESVTLIHSFKTRHIKYVSKLEFSRDGDFVVSLGGPPYQQSIEVYSLPRQQSICFKYIQDACFYDVKFNPYDHNQIAVCGIKSLWIMRVSNHSLIKKQCAVLPPNEEITCMVYTSSVYGNSIESDLITGNSNGDLCLFICGKYITCKKSAHEKSINCLVLCQLFKYRTIIVSAGEDNFVKLWDIKFNQIKKINIRDIIFPSKIPFDISKISIAPQSIDVYHCFSQIKNNQGKKLTKNQNEQNENNSETMLLIGTRNGSILQIKINNQYQGLRVYEAERTSTGYADTVTRAKISQLEADNTQMKQKQINLIPEKIKISNALHFNNIPSAYHRSVLFDIKGNLMITYSKSNQYFVLWGIQKREMLKLCRVSGYPSIIKFSQTNFVCVGYIDGRVQFLEFRKDSAYNFVLRQQKLFLDSDYQPTRIICSDNDSRIAVTYSKQAQQKRMSNNAGSSLGREEAASSEGDQFLMIYEKIFSSSHAFVSNQRNTHRVQSDKKKFKNIFWCEFSSGGNKLLICYTLNDYLSLNNSNRRRIMGSFQGNHYQPLYEYVLYDVVRRMEKDLANEEFNVLNFSPSVRAKYHYYSECSIIDENYGSFNKNEELQDNCGNNKRKPNLASHESNLNKTTSNQLSVGQGQQHSNISHLQHISSMPTNSVSISPLGNQLVEQYVPICQMTQFEKFTIMGTIYGEIFAVKSECFYSQSLEQSSESQLKKVKAKCYACFDSPINNMQVVGSKLYVSAQDCSSIFQYQMCVQEGSERLIFEQSQSKIKGKNNYLATSTGVISSQLQKFTPQKIQNWLKYVFPKRKNFYEFKLNCQQKKISKENQNKTQNLTQNLSQSHNINQNLDEGKQQEFDQLIMHPRHIIGRNAYYKRNNILIDLKDNLISFSGCNLLIMTPSQRKNEYKQQFLKLDNSIMSTNPEISTITLSDDKRTLYAGTTEQGCQVILWNISTRTELEHIRFKQYVSILLIKPSEQQRHAVVLALSRQAKQVIFFLSLKTFQILASFCVSEEADICDIAFLPGNQFKFVACGVNYMAEWALKGGLLTCEKYTMKNPKDFIDLNNQISIKDPVIFYSIIFIRDVAITGGSDGYLYMWGDKTLIKKQNANPKAAILSLYSSKNSKIFASGAIDGKAIIWQLGSSSIIQKVFEFSIYSGKQLATPSKFHIQSVNIGKNDIFIGTRSGQIYKFEFTPNENAENQQCFASKQSHSLILSAFDNDQINSCSFNISSQKLYVLTQSGIFSVFNLHNNQKIKQQRIKIDDEKELNNEEIVKMLVCKVSSKIYIVFKKSIDVYSYIEDGKHSNKFSKLKQNLKSVNSEIKAVILSSNQKYLALLMSPNQLQNAKIEIYDVDQKEGKQLFVLYKVLENIPANIEIIDFSTDDGYLVYKNSDEDQTIIDLTTKQMINTNMIQFELQWNGEAKKTSKYIRDICSTYSDQNKLRTILQIMDHSILATDEMGSVRMFRYEQNIEESSIEYYSIYLQHLNDLYLCIISSDCSILVTVGSHDRSIIIWKIENFDMLAQKHLHKKKLNRNQPKSIEPIEESEGRPDKINV